MCSPRPSPIVADGRERILEGSGREAANRMRARFTRRTRTLVQQTSLVGRLFIRWRRERFIRRQMEKIAPPGALYVGQRFPFAESSDTTSSVFESEMSNQSLQPTAGRFRCTLTKSARVKINLALI